MSALEPTPLAELTRLLERLVHQAAEDRVTVDKQEAARLLGVKDSRIVDRLIQAGDIRARKPRGSSKTLISVQSLHEYIGDKQ